MERIQQIIGLLTSNDEDYRKLGANIMCKTKFYKYFSHHPLPNVRISFAYSIYAITFNLISTHTNKQYCDDIINLYNKWHLYNESINEGFV